MINNSRGFGDACCLRSCLLALLFLLSSDGCIAQDYTVPELVSMASVVCIGTASAIQVQGPGSIATGNVTAGGQPARQPAIIAVAKFNVKIILKGALTSKTVAVTFPQDEPNQVGANILPYAPIIVGQRVLLFLQRSADGGLSLFAPTSYPPPVFPIGSATLEMPATASTTLRKTLLVFTQTLAGSTKQTQIAALERIQSVSFLLDYRSSLLDDAPLIAKMRESLQEPKSARLEVFISAQVLPAVRGLERSPDVDVSASATATAAYLQDVWALPLLVSKIAVSGPNVRPNLLLALRG